MYLVTLQEFNQYLEEENIKKDKIIFISVPCIIQYKRGEILKAKVEVVSQSAYEWNERYKGECFKESSNKYWIRGKERPPKDTVNIES